MTNQDAVLPQIGEKYESGSLKPRTRQGFPFPPHTPVQKSFQCTCWNTKAREGN